MRNGITSFVRLLILLLVMSPLGALARVVGVDQAARVVATFLRVPQTRGGDGVRLAWHSGRLDRTTRAGEEPLFYVFEPTSGRGFVIVSGDDAVQPVLAYSLRDAAPRLGDMPEGLVWWLDNMSAQIRAVRESGGGELSGDRSSNAGKQDGNVADEVAKLRARVAKQWAQAAPGNIVTLLTTALWNQDRYFNWFCPTVGGKSCYTGCGPTAVAIMMRYYRWPRAGRGVAEAYTTYSTGLSIPARDLNHAYDWDLMPLTYTNSCTNAQAEEVSKLMFDIGCAIQADYGVKETGAYIDPAVLYKNFDYHPNLSWEMRENYADAPWLSMLKEELEAERPVVYSGLGLGNAGHYFILDGYTADDYFHVNWGWGGYDNGFYTLSALIPAGGSYPGGFSDNQWALINFCPNDGCDPSNWLRLISTFALFDDGVVPGKPFKFHYVDLMNYTPVDFEGHVRACLVSREGRVKEVVSQEMPCKAEAMNGYFIGGSDMLCTINGSIDFGDRLRIYYKSNTSDEWYPVIARIGESTAWEIPVADEYSIAESTSFTFDRRGRIITLTTKSGVIVRLFSAVGEDLSSYLQTEGTTIRIPVKQLQPADYTLRLSKGRDTKELTFSVKPYTR